MPWQNMNTFETYKTMNTDITMEKKGKTRLFPPIRSFGSMWTKNKWLIQATYIIGLSKKA